jgi:hypothetical protein
VYALRVILTLGLGLGIILFAVTGCGAGGCGAGGCAGGSGGGSTICTLAPLGLRGGGFLLGTASVARIAARAAARAFTSKGLGLAIFGTTGSTDLDWDLDLDLDLFFFFFLDLSFSGAIFFGSL